MEWFDASETGAKVAQKKVRFLKKATIMKFILNIFTGSLVNMGCMSKKWFAKEQKFLVCQNHLGLFLGLEEDIET